MTETSLAFPERAVFAHRNLMDFGVWGCVLIFGSYPCMLGCYVVTPLLYLGCGLYLLGVSNALYQRPRNDFAYGMELGEAITLWFKGKRNESRYWQSLDAKVMAWFYLIPGIVSFAAWVYFQWKAGI